MRINALAGLAAVAALTVVAGAAAARADTSDVGAHKQAFEAREQAEHSRAWRAPKHPGFLPQSKAPIGWRTGIIDSGLAPLPGGVFDIANQWHANVGDRHVIVYAGSYRNTPQGVLVVLQLALDGSAASGPRVVPLSPRSGAARITGANGDTLLVATSSGKLLSFRVPVGRTLHH